MTTSIDLLYSNELVLTCTPEFFTKEPIVEFKLLSPTKDELFKTNISYDGICELQGYLQDIVLFDKDYQVFFALHETLEYANGNIHLFRHEGDRGLRIFFDSFDTKIKDYIHYEIPISEDQIEILADELAIFISNFERFNVI